MPVATKARDWETAVFVIAALVLVVAVTVLVVVVTVLVVLVVTMIVLIEQIVPVLVVVSFSLKGAGVFPALEIADQRAILYVHVVINYHVLLAIVEGRHPSH